MWQTPVPLQVATLHPQFPEASNSHAGVGTPRRDNDPRSKALCMRRTISGALWSALTHRRRL